MEIYKVERQDRFSKALNAGNSQQTTFQTFVSQNASPLAQSSIQPVSGTEVVDGVYPLGGLGWSPNTVRVMPYCEGQAGESFSMRLWGWYPYDLPSGNLQNIVWLPQLLCELACYAGNQPGPFPPTWRLDLGGAFRQSENLCDTIVLTQGMLGQDGWINSTGGQDQGNAGTGLPAQAKVCLSGAAYLQFDFQQGTPVNMNCFFALSS